MGTRGLLVCHGDIGNDFESFPAVIFELELVHHPEHLPLAKRR